MPLSGEIPKHRTGWGTIITAALMALKKMMKKLHTGIISLPNREAKLERIIWHSFIN